MTSPPNYRRGRKLKRREKAGEDEMTEIAIVEDTKEHVQTLQAYLREFANENDTEFHTTVFHNAVNFLENYSARYDIVFMDIAMPYLNGMDAARALRKLDENVILIFMTSLAQYAVQGYDVDAFAYLVKPISYSDFSMKFVRAYRRLAKKERGAFVLGTRQGSVRLLPEEIAYCEVSGHKTIFHTVRGDYVQHTTLSAVQKKLDATLFCKCNHCYLVNLHCVKSMFDDEIEIAYAGQNCFLHVSRSKRKVFCAALKNIWGELSQGGENF